MVLPRGLAGRLCGLGLVAGSLAAGPVPPPAARPADLLIVGAPVYAMDAARTWAEAVAIASGRVVYVGSANGGLAWTGPATRVVRLTGGLVLPAFQDAHAHPVSGGVELAQCDLNGLPDAQAIEARIAQCASRASPWLLGGGWAVPAFAGGSPHRQDLDRLVGDRPAYLTAADGHSAWVSSRALALAGIVAATPDPAGGRIERDPGSNEPSGTLREAAMDLVARLAPEPTQQERLAGLLEAQQRFLRHGVTAVQEASAGPAELAVYREAADRGLLDLRVIAAQLVDPERGPEQIEALVRRRRELSGQRLQAPAAKLFLDGVIEARTAAMLTPYTDRPGDAGQAIWTDVRLQAVVDRLVEEGFDLHFHAIGDRAVRQALDAIERAAPRDARADPRHQIAHLEVIHPDDIPRFRRLRVSANFQALWAYADSYIRDLTWPALGGERSRWLYPIGAVVRSGGSLAFGSDWSVSSLDPLQAIEVAITRRGPDGEPDPPLLPEQAVDLPTALAAATIGAARANGIDAESGSLEPGKAADLVVLDRNLFEIPAPEIGSARVLLSLARGEVLWADPALGLEGSPAGASLLSPPVAHRARARRLCPSSPRGRSRRAARGRACRRNRRG